MPEQKRWGANETGVYLARQQEKKAIRIIQRYDNEKFKRFRVFCSAVKAVFADSDPVTIVEFSKQ